MMKFMGFFLHQREKNTIETFCINWFPFIEFMRNRYNPGLVEHRSYSMIRRVVSKESILPLKSMGDIQLSGN